jgi:hypothetical protein
MKNSFLFVTAGALFINCSVSAGQDISASASGKSEWVYTDQSGKLAYKLTRQGDRIMDFSHAGYKGGGVVIPEVSVKSTLSPSGKEDTGNIQAAIDKVSAMPLNGEFRGAVLLSAGKYSISSPIVIRTSGVILKGSGSGIDVGQESILMMSGKAFNAVTIRKERNSTGPVSTGTEKITTITDSYVPSGAVEFSVVDASGFRKGDVVSIEKKVTSAWIEHMQMHNLVRDGKPQTWIKAGSTLAAGRRIAGISGNKIILDVPLSDSYSKTFGDVEVKTVQPDGLKNCGIEHLHIVSPSQPVSHSEPHFTALRLNGEDCWAKDLFIEETMNSVGVSGKRITVQNVTVLRKALHVGSSRPAEFAPNGTQVLIDRCKVIADNVWFMATGSGIAGPIVILNCEFIGDQRAESHQRWSTGMLYDNVKALNGGIDFRNRGSMGSGHGWSMGWGVAWNCEAKDFIIQTPPGAFNWMIGCIGESKLMPRPFDKEPMLPEGIRDSPGVHVAPKSLYLAQLKERLGEQGLRNIGY